MTTVSKLDTNARASYEIEKRRIKVVLPAALQLSAFSSFGGSMANLI
jgi:hypothetical protein